MQPFRGEEAPTTTTSLNSRDEAGGTKTIGGRLRNPFLKRPCFTGGFVFFFARGTTPITLLRTRLADNFEASRETNNSPIIPFHKMTYPKLPSPPVIMLKRMDMQQGGEERIFSPNTKAPERRGGTKTKGPAPHELLENSELTNSPAVAGGATRVAGANSSGAGKGGKKGREADLTGEDVGSVFRQLDDPPLGGEIPKNTPEDISGRSLDSRDTLDLGRKRPNQRLVRL
jgi:hypothetical protein